MGYVYTYEYGNMGPNGEPGITETDIVFNGTVKWDVYHGEDDIPKMELHLNYGEWLLEH